MLRIAVAQTPGNHLDQWPKVHELVEELVRRAANGGADIVLFPECLWPAYFIGSTQDYFAARDAGLPSDRWFLAQLATWARTHRIAICAGFVAARKRRLFNAACLISEAGEVLGTHDKCFLWDFDHAFFERGCSLSAVRTPWGPVGLMICADARLPETCATLAARGARLILHPTAWVNVGSPEQCGRARARAATRLWNPQPELLVPDRAREFGIPIASASKWGVEGQTTFVGSSLICDGAGNVLAQCGTSETTVIIADVTLRPPQPPRLTPSQRARLLGPEPPELPTANAPPLRVVLLKEYSDFRSLTLRGSDSGRSARGGRARARAATRLLQSRNARDAGVFTLFLAPPAPTSRTGKIDRGDKWLLVVGPTDGIHSLGAARVAGVRDRDAASFAPIRALAFGGVHLVVVFGEGVSARTLRSRAAENRIFLVHATSAGLSAYDPRGCEVGTAPPCDAAVSEISAKEAVLELDVAQAADKEFAPRTNPFTGRRPELYDF